ncbi:MAG TPA: ATP-dependent RNA helicase RhlB, partial [Xanthomonadaceae bacterium]|nr:ATP-dependent RNA helicase RhlB [Xanthomonadaceae bacterium]
LFSATLSHRVLELAYEHMNEPEKIVVESEFITNSTVRQLMYFPSDEEKIHLLLGLLSRSEGARTMVFVNTKAWVERVARALERSGYKVGVLSGDVPQKKRESLLAKFQKGQLEILVATDVAARGLHIDGVSHVYNYDLPFDAEDYVHRIGRTARLGAEGDAISFACERYAQGLPEIEAFIEQKIPVEPVTAELLVSLPRKPRTDTDPAAADPDGESISAIFKEAREQRAADDARRGVTRSGGGRAAGSGNDRSGRASSPRSGERRAPRAAGSASKAPPAADLTSADVPATPPVQASPAPITLAAADTSERAPRKRRRRRGGVRIEQATELHQDAATPTARRELPTTGTPTAPASLIARIGKGLKSLVTRAPRNQH